MAYMGLRTFIVRKTIYQRNFWGQRAKKKEAWNKSKEEKKAGKLAKTFWGLREKGPSQN